MGNTKVRSGEFLTVPMRAAPGDAVSGWMRWGAGRV